MPKPSVTDDESYFAAHSRTIEEALSDAMNHVIDCRSAAPLCDISTFLAKHALSHGDKSIASVRHFLREVDGVAQDAKRSLESLQEAGHKTSRTGYLKALPEIIGPDPRPPEWLARRSDSWHDSWRDDWRRMYLEYTGASTEPESGWQAVENDQTAKLAKSIRVRTEEDSWSYGAAEAYTWLSSVEARNPMARALREGSPTFAAATYALCSPSRGAPRAHLLTGSHTRTATSMAVAASSRAIRRGSCWRRPIGTASAA